MSKLNFLHKMIVKIRIEICNWEVGLLTCEFVFAYFNTLFFIYEAYCVSGYAFFFSGKSEMLFSSCLYAN